MNKDVNLEYTQFILEHLTTKTKNKWYEVTECSILDDFYKENDVDRNSFLEMVMHGGKDICEMLEFEIIKEEYFEKRFKKWKNDKTRTK